MSKWYILNRDGEPLEEKELPERPAEAKPDEGDSFRPWFKDDEHLHIEDGRIEGIHAKGTLNEVQEVLQKCLEHERALLERFGGQNDVLLKEVIPYV